MGFTESIYVLASITTAIFLEAMPFLAIGALFAAVIEVYMPVDRLARFIPKSFLGGVALGVTAGFVIPTCECGVVPIVRRLIMKGVPPYIAITYMLAAPIINPVVLASTYIAFRGDLPMVTGRVVIAAMVAAALGFYVKRMDKDAVLNDAAQSQLNNETCHHHGDINDHDGCSHSHDTVLSNRSKMTETMIHAAHEFFDMGKFLIIGAFTAALFKTFVPQDVMAYFSGNLFLSIFGMMTLAVLLSICSEADAFVAASFISFPAVAQLSFVTIGPMVDLKLIGMFAATFNRRVFRALLIGPTVIIFIVTMMLGFLM
jgi:uncharacterized membrane protein YraQ (UPF0718 family)